jgi:hypothetical protein
VDTVIGGRGTQLTRDHRPGCRPGREAAVPACREEKRMKKLMIAGVVLGLAVTLVPVRAQKNSSISIPADTVVFADRDTPAVVDGIRSDNHGNVLRPSDPPQTYRNTVGGVQITVNNIQAGGTGDLTMSLFSTKNPVRYIRFLLSNPTNIVSGISVPRDEIHDKAFLNVKNIWDVKMVGVPASRLAIFTLSEGELRFATVAVERLSPTEWRVSTDDVGVGGSPLARYFAKAKSRLTYAADYSLPFQFEVTCDACARPPAGSR